MPRGLSMRYRYSAAVPIGYLVQLMRKACLHWLMFALIVVGSASNGSANAALHDRPRLLVLTDIGQDPDDLQSLVRLLHYANEFSIEGIVATADNNYEHESATIRDDIVHETLDRYAEVLPNLRQHDARFPSAASLHAVVKPGSPWGGREVAVDATIGPDRDTAGSEHIIARVDAESGAPLNIAVWGGACDLAQALWKVRETRSATELGEFLSRIRVFSIGAQDSTSNWVRDSFPSLFYVYGYRREGGSFDSGYRGMFLGGDLDTLSKEWIYAHVKSGHGPLGEVYPDRAWTQDNPHMCIKEGDTPSFFYFLPNGLQDPAEPGWGGWGGRFGPVGHYWQDLPDTMNDVTSYRVAVWRWREHFQNDFAARADWAVQSYEQANHHPEAVLQGDRSRDILRLAAEVGDTLELSAAGSSDPDGDSLAYRWWVYWEASALDQDLPIEDAGSQRASLRVPASAAGKSIHVILEVSDDGAPSLVSYRRLLVDVSP